MAEEKLNTEELNQDVKNWSKETLGKLKAMLQMLGIRDTGELLKSLKGKVGFDFGVANRISFGLKIQGIWVEKGVGKGYPIESVKGNGVIIQAAGKKGRVPKPWFNPVLNEQLPRLADMVAEKYGDITLSNLDNALIK